MICGNTLWEQPNLTPPQLWQHVNLHCGNSLPCGNILVLHSQSPSNFLFLLPFDVFAKFCSYEDSTYVWLDMLNFVAENMACYEWDTHILLKMHGTNLSRRVATMTDCLNKGDELAIYAMCDMFKQKVFVFVHTKPWATVDSSITTLTVPELCMMCDVTLIYLGDNKYSEIKCKPEVLSPLPKLIQPKQETPITNPTMITSQSLQHRKL